MFDSSVQFFTWARQWCERHATGVEVVAELQIGPAPGENVIRIGDNYEELLELAERSGVRLCWDFGHAVMNARRRGDAVNPPEDFYRRVAHVHCHDVGDEDHWPLVFGNVPWERFIDKLARAGFDGTVILEVPAERFLAQGGFESMQQSLKLLRERMGIA